MILPKWATFFACAALTALRASDASGTSPTTPFQYWQDPCGYGIPTPYVGDISRMTEAVAMLVPKAYLKKRPDDPNYYYFTETSPNVNYPGSDDPGDPASGVPLAGDSPFLNETRYAPRGRSAFLISPNVVVTAAHSPNPPGAEGNFDPRNFWVVFDMREKPTAPGVCTPPNGEYIPAENVYEAKPFNQMPVGDALIADTMLYYRQPEAGGGTLPLFIDYAAFYLNRAAPSSRRYLRIRDHGHLAAYDNFAILGHPYRLPAKLLFGMTYTKDESIYQYPSYTSPNFADFYLMDGMSGAPVYNVDRDYVEVAASGYSGKGCTNFVEPNSTFNPTNTWLMRDGCDQTVLPGERVQTGVNPGSIAYLTSLVSTPYLRVEPLDDVTYVLPVNGSPTPTQTTYTATASSSAAANTIVSAYLSAPPSGQPAFLQLGGYNTPLTPGSSTNITVTASVPSSTACGIYDRYVTVGDLTHSFSDTMRHRFEIGMTDFTVTPDDTPDVYAVTAPSFPESLTYTLTNTRPTAVTVEVFSSQSWLSITPSSTIVLAPAGQSGSAKSVVVKPSTAAYSLPVGDYPFTVTFDGQGTCQLNVPVQRAGVLHRGVIRYGKSFSIPVPSPTPANAPVTDAFTIAATFCTSDVKVRFRSKYAGEDHTTGWGLPWSILAPSMRIFIDKTGNQGVTSQVWNLNPLPWTVPYEEGPEESTIETLQLDRTQNIPPTGAGSLSIFNNKDAAGQWSFRFYDDGIQTVNTGVLEGWEIEVYGSPFCSSEGG